MHNSTYLHRSIDVDKGLLTSAIRLNNIYESKSKFLYHNLKKKLKLLKKYDTGFVFAVDKHIKDNVLLAKNIKNNIKQVIYFETHSKSEIPKEILWITEDPVLLNVTQDFRKLYRLKIKD